VSKFIRRTIYASIFSSLFLIAQVFILTSQTALNYATNAISGIAERFGYTQLLDKGAIGLQRRNDVLRAKNTKLIAKRKSQRASVRALSSKVAKRTARNVSVSATSSVGEALPYVGAGFVVAALTMDVMDGCSTMNDMNALMVAFTDEKNEQHQQENSKFTETVKSVCATSIPSTEGILAATEETLDKAGNSLNTGLSEAKEGWDEMTYNVGEVTYGVAESLSIKVKSWKEKWSETVGGTIATSVENTKNTAHNAGEVIKGTSREISRNAFKKYDSAVQSTSKAIQWLLD